MSSVSKALPLPEIFYGPKQQYFIANDRNRWITINENSAKRHLKDQGYSSKVDKGKALSSLDDCIGRIQLEQDVVYAAPLAGYMAGVYDINNKRILVTDSPRFIEPKEGEWPLLNAIFEGMFHDPACDQRPYVYGWLKTAVTALRAGKWQPGQVLALAGPVRSAKSLFQAIVTELLGGRSAQPYQYMSGGSTFNADLFAAEHLMVEDAAESTDLRTRRHFGALIKSFAVNRTQHCHGKQKDALTLTPCWRVTISLNDEAERLLVLPPLNEDIADKIMLLKVTKKEMPMPTTNADEQEAFWNALLGEMPAFLHHLQTWTIPKELQSPRFGITHYHHPDLVAGLAAHAPEEQLLEMIDSDLFHKVYGEKNAWEGTALQLQRRLTRDGSGCREQAETLLRSPSSCGTYLTRLVNEVPERFSSKRNNRARIYTIQPPLREEATATVETN